MKRLLSLLLASVISLSALAACAEDGDKTPDTTPDSTSDSAAPDTSDTTPPETTADPTALPATDLDGFEFRAFVRGSEENDYWKCVDLYYEDYAGDDIVDAVFDRNGHLKDTYNFTISQKESGKSSLVEARNLITSGDTDFHAMCLRATYCASLAAEAQTLDLLTVPHLQLDQPWWDANVLTDLTIGGRLFFTTGDLSISCNDALQIPVFNKTVLAAQDGLENPYDLVREGKWTMDKMMEMAMQVNKDSNGDGTMTEADTWGYLAYPWGALFLYFGSGETVVRKNENDIPELAVNNERSVNVIEKLYEIQGGANTDVVRGTSVLQTTLMSENRVLFTITSLATVRKQFRESVDSDIGILPVPKYEETQDGYHNLVVFQDTANMYLVPKTCPDLEKTGFALEAIAQASTDTLREAYYDKVISYKALRDQDSLEMLKIILATRVYDLASAFDWGGWNNYFTSFANSRTNQFASFYRKLEGKTQQAIEDTVAAFNASATK